MTVYKQLNGVVSTTTVEDLKQFVAAAKEIEVDTETTGLDPQSCEIMCVQLGTPVVQYLFPWDASWVPYLMEIFQDTSKLYLFQNAKFDLKFFHKYGIHFPNNIYDTFLAETILHCGDDTVRKSLDKLAERYLNVDLSKEIQSQVNILGLTKEVIQYALNDVKYLSRIKEKQMRLLTRRDLLTTARLDFSFVRVLAYIEFSGIGFDKDKWLEKAEIDEQKLKEATEALDQMVVEIGDPRFVSFGDLFSGGETVCKINWNAEKQVLPLFIKLGLNTITEEKGELKNSIGAPIMRPQKDKHPIVPLWLDYQKYSKRVSTFGKKYINFISPETGRIHTEYKQIVNTGRMSCGRKGKKKGEEAYPNLQQVPKKGVERTCFIAEEGNSLINADYSGQESIVFANKAMDRALLAFYDNGLGDMHLYVAKLCFVELADYSLEGLGDMLSVAKDKIENGRSSELTELEHLVIDLRDKAKSAGFAIQFGGNGYTISANLGLAPSVGAEIYEAYMSAFEGVADYFKKMSDEAIRRGYLEFNDVTKRKSYIAFHKRYLKGKEQMDKMDWSAYRREKAADSDYYKNVLKPKVREHFSLQGTITRRSYNYPVQGTAADITKTACCLIYEDILKENLLYIVKFVHVVHDEIIVEAPKELAKNIAVTVREGMEKAGSYYCKRVPLKATPVISQIWEH